MDMIQKLNSLSSAIISIKHGLEQEEVEEQALYCLETISNSVLGICQFAQEYLFRIEKTEHNNNI